jgi:hypothetical protein
MSKHRAPRNRYHFLIAGCTLALATIFVLLAHYVGHSVITPPVSAKVVSQITPETPRSDPLQPLIQLEQQRQQAEQAQERAALAQQAADRKAAADAAAAAAAEEARKAAAEKAAQEAAAKAAAEKAAADAAAAKAQAAATPAPPSTSRALNVDAYKAYAAGKVDATQFSCLDQMWMHESSWNPNADNPTSTAYGIPQFLDSTWAGTGYAKTSDPYTQIDAGLVYIAKAYGTPCGAWSFWQANHYY